MRRTFNYFEIKSPDDMHGLVGQFDTEADALNHINNSYANALRQGYDNRNDKWVLVCVEVSKEFNKKGEFLKEETIRFVTESVQFDEYEDKFVFAY